MAGIAFDTDGWRGMLAQEFTFAGVAVIAQAIAAYLTEEGTAERGMLIGYDNVSMGHLFAERVAEVLAGNGIPALLLNAAASRSEVEAELAKRGLAGSVMITVSEQGEQGGFFFASAGGGTFVNAVQWHVREIERERTEVRVMPYARGLRAGTIRLTALNAFDGAGQFSYNAC